MVPILEEELLGYELVPAGLAETCLTLGCKPDGEPVLRKECLANVTPDALHLATMDGRTIARAARALSSRSGRRDMRFPDWPSAAKFACAELEHLSPGAPRRPPLLNTRPNASLERSARRGRIEARAVEPHHPFLRPAKRRAVWICALWRRWRTRRTFSPSGSVDTALEIRPRSRLRNMVGDSRRHLPVTGHDAVTGDAPNVQRISARTKSLR